MAIRLEKLSFDILLLAIQLAALLLQSAFLFATIHEKGDAILRNIA
tara:strand:+ start:292 stop:429 length:138 start_codon:yes stop_codon:yes gene_type:complete